MQRAGRAFRVSSDGPIDAWVAHSSGADETHVLRPRRRVRLIATSLGFFPGLGERVVPDRRVRHESRARALSLRHRGADGRGLVGPTTGPAWALRPHLFEPESVQES
jgi:hypothetical protein